MSETWLHRNIHSQLVCPSGYTIVRKDRSDSREGGEVAIACRNDWKIATLDNNSIFLLSPVRDINRLSVLHDVCLPSSRSYI